MSVFRSKSEILLLEPCDGKLSRTVLRGESARKGADLPALNTDNQTCELDYYAASNTSVTIPKTVEYEGKTYTVTEIGERAFFYNKTIEEIILPQTITKINHSGFAE